MSNARDKVFGLENFGNTCYCNSILQCLFYAKPFRDYILSLNQVARPPRLETPGKTSHQFADQQAQQQLPSSTGSNTSGIRLGRKKDKPEIQDLPPALEGLDIGIWKPGRGIPIVGYTEVTDATPELKKRAALTKGPIINLDHSLSHEYNMEESLLTALKDLFECIQENASNTGIASPSFLIELLKKKNDLFRSSMHQDAHEFYSFLLNSILEIVDQDYIRDMFEGCLTNELKCVTCETTSYRDEKFLDLSLDLENNSSLNQCLRQFSKSEVLGGQNKFHCDKCGGLQEAQKRLKVKRAPLFLTLHLKRFKYSEDDNENIKLQHRVAYPKYLKLPVVSGNQQDFYELKSVVVHLGGGPYQGHYVSVIKTECGWLLFDDESVEAVDETYVFKFFGDNNRLTCAYVLFYQRIDRETFERDNLYVNTEVSHCETESVLSASDLSSVVLSEDGNRDSDVGLESSRRRRSTVNSTKMSKDSKLFGIFRRPSATASPTTQNADFN